MKEKETIEYLDLKHLVPFRNHPFKLRDGEEKEQLLQSIKTQGAIEPLIVRPLSESEYEVISGHRRLEICKELGMEKIPVIVRNLSDEQAVSMMVDANLHRNNILPSERAFAYKMKWEAAKKSEKTLSQPATRMRNDDVIAQSLGIGKDTLHRYIRLTYLIPELLEMVDEGRIALTPAVELSYLTEQEQHLLLNEIEYADATPSLSQAQRLRGFSRQGRLTADVIFAVMSEEKANQKEQIRFPKEEIQKYFPKSYTGKDMQNTILKLLEKWQRQRERNAKEER
ncbi:MULTISPECIES: ParB/RepB/Spo0J family partition protein [Eubacteriales]|uniref:Chromosome partitioning protein, ParB family n=1 Tax=Bittarella massiliensis (ex Durand et al. 2017) TaxID=1720313 RepID=A0AAQ1RWB7_9FIRM|nr:MULTISPECIES: ParB/RepB/Spo0J family partition protein [Eubacteriales]SHG19044.1 chromosome partitioning protein, ParB family [Bittarella massiliensis (ex Durand et al. 2017)]